MTDSKIQTSQVIIEVNGLFCFFFLTYINPSNVIFVHLSTSNHHCVDLQVLQRVTHAFWWAWLQTRGKFGGPQENLLCASPCCMTMLFLFSCWCSLYRTHPSRWCRVWRTLIPNTPACLCWLQQTAHCVARWSSQVSVGVKSHLCFCVIECFECTIQKRQIQTGIFLNISLHICSWYDILYIRHLLKCYWWPRWLEWEVQWEWRKHSVLVGAKTWPNASPLLYFSISQKRHCCHCVTVMLICPYLYTRNTHELPCIAALVVHYATLKF